MIENIVQIAIGLFGLVPQESKEALAKRLAELALDHVPISELRDHLTLAAQNRATVAALAAEAAKFGVDPC